MFQVLLEPYSAVQPYYLRFQVGTLWGKYFNGSIVLAGQILTSDVSQITGVKWVNQFEEMTDELNSALGTDGLT